MAKHVCDICLRKMNSDEAYEIHMLTHVLNRLTEAIEYYVSMKDERRV